MVGGAALVPPSCGRKGKRVSTATVPALLKDEYAGEVLIGPQSICEPTDDGRAGCQPLAGDTGWRFCDSADCDVVYLPLAVVIAWLIFSSAF